jgi:hypothetical protein
MYHCQHYYISISDFIYSMNTFDIGDINFTFQWVGINRNKSCKASISRNPHFKPRPGTHYSDQTFTGFALSVEVIAHIFLQTRHHCFCPHDFQFTVRHFVVSSTGKAGRWTTGRKQNRIFTYFRNGFLILPSGVGQTIVLERLRKSLFSSGRLYFVL